MSRQQNCYICREVDGMGQGMTATKNLPSAQTSISMTKSQIKLPTHDVMKVKAKKALDEKYEAKGCRRISGKGKKHLQRRQRRKGFFFAFLGYNKKMFKQNNREYFVFSESTLMPRKNKQIKKKSRKEEYFARIGRQRDSTPQKKCKKKPCQIDLLCEKISYTARG